MRIVELKIYNYEELNKEAQLKARNWYNENFFFYDECIIDDAKVIAALMGIEIDKIYYTGFYSQGDGACFEGKYSYKKGALKAVKEYAPKDETIHAIASELQNIQKRHSYKLTAWVKHSGHYSHDQCTSIAVERNDKYFFDTADSYVRGSTHDGASLVIILRNFMKWIYAQFENEYRYQTSDELVTERMIANDYKFTADGSFYQ